MVQRRSNNTELKWKIEKRLLSFKSAQFLLALAEQGALGTFSSLLPPDLATWLRSAFSSPGLCFSPGRRCLEALFTIFTRDSKQCKGVYCVALGESFLLANFGFDTAENGPSRVWRYGV